MNNDTLIDQILVNRLKDSILVLLRLEPLCDEDKETMRSLVKTLSYFVVHTDFEKFYSEYGDKIELVLSEGNPKPNTFTVNCISENTDGSANVEIELGANVSKTIIGEGVNFLLLKAIVEGDTDQILRWSQRGKQEEIRL
jgi:hypothetical protein